MDCDAEARGLHYIRCPSVFTPQQCVRILALLVSWPQVKFALRRTVAGWASTFLAPLFFNVLRGIGCLQGIFIATTTSGREKCSERFWAGSVHFLPGNHVSVGFWFNFFACPRCQRHPPTRQCRSIPKTKTESNKKLRWVSLTRPVVQPTHDRIGGLYGTREANNKLITVLVGWASHVKP